MAKYIALGMRMVIAGSDRAILMAGVSQRTKLLRGT
jgi:hypothetical protein